MQRTNSRNEQLGNIWDVVSNLAHALTGARDQLVGLINFPGTRGFRNARRGGQGKENIRHGDENVPGNHELARYRGGGYIPTGGKLRNVHRQHARGHVAFGVHSEFKPMPAGGNCKARKPERAPPGKGGKKGAQFWLYMDPNSNSLQINTKKGADNPVRINFGDPNPGPQYACKEDANCRPSSPDSKRHCMGTQYAALLKEEAFRIRERRLAEEKDPNAKPKWSRY